MAHGSSPHHHHHHGTPDSSTRNIGVAFWLNLGFAIIELIGGIWTQSLAVISDALHDFGDAISLGMGYFLQRKSTQGPSENYSYGLRRLSLLSAFLTGLILCIGAVFIVSESVSRFSEPHEPYGPGMMGLAIFGIAINGFAAWKLGHGHTHNEKMMQWHLIEDVMGWVAVLIGSICIMLFQWNWLDPVLAITISLFVLFNVVKRLSQTVSVFLQGNPDPEGLKTFREKVSQMPNIVEVHDVHFWSLDGVRHVLSLHAVLKDLNQGAQTKEEIRRLSKALGDCHITLEIESQTEHCHDDCENIHDHNHA